MNIAMPSHQRGLSLGGFMVGVFIVILASIVGLKLVPAYLQNEKIKKVFVAIAQDPEMQRASPSEIRSSFERRSSIDDITAIKAGDIEVVSDGGAPYLSASYAMKIPLVANISFLLEFNPSSAK